MQVDAAAVHPLPAAERVMTEHEIDPVDLQFGIARDAVPAFRLRQRVIVAEDQVLPALQEGQDFRGARQRAGKVAEMPDFVSLPDRRIPARDHFGIHGGDRGKRARIQVEHPMIAEMRVADEEYGHRYSIRIGRARLAPSPPRYQLYYPRMAGRGCFVTAAGLQVWPSGGPRPLVEPWVREDVAMHIRNPVEWSVDQLRLAGHAVESVGRAGREARGLNAPAPAVRRIGTADIRDALRRGLDDFAVFRTDVAFLCVIYPLAGLVLARLAFGYDMLPLLFPLASGFALIGPVAAVGLYEMSRRREQGVAITWGDAFGVFRSPSFGAIVVLGLLLMALFLLWLVAAEAIYQMTLGPAPPASFTSFVRDVFTTD